MRVLAYCVALNPPDHAPLPGVSGEQALVLRQGNLSCCYSQLSDEALLADSRSLKQAALEFHRLIASLLASAAILPFRFPTLLDDVAELEEALLEQHDDLVHQLNVMGDGVQMEVRLSGSSPAQNASGGAEYLKQKAARTKMFNAAAEQFRREMGPRVRQWRAKEDTQGLKLFALVDRSAVEDFRSSAPRIALPLEVAGRVSGPWPAMEFVGDSPLNSTREPEEPCRKR